VARDAEWAATLSEAWLESAAHVAQERRVPYDCGETRLHGVLVSPAVPKGGAVVMFHTAAGPRDLFLHWKANQLAHLGVFCFIADLYGDETGRGWSDPSIRHGIDGLGARASAAVDALAKELDDEDDATADSESSASKNVAAVGYCLGGRAAVAALKNGETRLKAVVSFHGVLDDSPILQHDGFRDAQLLVLHGAEDPYVPELPAFQAQMRGIDALCDVVVLARAQHGFTNPCQSLNERQGFDFDQRAADLAWSLATDRLLDVLRPSTTRERA